MTPWGFPTSYFLAIHSTTQLPPSWPQFYSHLTSSLLTLTSPSNLLSQHNTHGSLHYFSRSQLKCGHFGEAFPTPPMHASSLVPHYSLFLLYLMALLWPSICGRSKRAEILCTLHCSSLYVWTLSGIQQVLSKRLLNDFFPAFRWFKTESVKHTQC